MVTKLITKGAIVCKVSVGGIVSIKRMYMYNNYAMGIDHGYGGDVGKLIAVESLSRRKLDLGISATYFFFFTST